MPKLIVGENNKMTPPQNYDGIKITLESWTELVSDIALIKDHILNLPCPKACKNSDKIEKLDRETRWIRSVPAKIIAIVGILTVTSITTITIIEIDKLMREESIVEATSSKQDRILNNQKTIKDNQMKNEQKVGK